MPYGPAYIYYNHTDPNRKDLSFYGIGVFTDGKLHMGPFTAVNGEGAGFSFSQMINGRPADSHYYTLFFPPNATRHDKSLETVSDVEGMQFCST